LLPNVILLSSQLRYHRQAIMVRVAILCICLAAVGCDDAPPVPDPGPSPGIEQITGNEQLGWDQRAVSAEELASFRYLLYVDNSATELQNVSCADIPADVGFPCSARLPQLSGGRHTLALSTFVDTGTRVESARSAALTVLVVSQAATSASEAGVPVVTTLDGLRLRVTVVATGLTEPTDLAFTPDGRILVAERAGGIRIVKQGRVEAAPAVMMNDVVATGRNGLLALAVDPDFERTGFVYAAYTAPAGLRLSRFRAVANTLGDRAILIEGIESSSSRPAALLRFGPDGKLYLGVDDADDPMRPGDLGSFNGKVLRLNPDATTPADQAGGTPVYAYNVSSPRGMDWDSSGRALWIVEDASGSEMLQVVEAQNARGRRASTIARYLLPSGTGASGLAFYLRDLIPAFRGNLLIAGDEGRAILRLRFDPSDARKVIATERLLRDVVGGIRAIGVAPDGTIYMCTSDALIQLAPAE
jgi:glucose/arabinose dehydrogenase